MLFVLRKIRHKLMQKSKLTSYLFYAFGEIVLVVIGILIALQINNWNQEKIQKTELEDLLHNISSNTRSDIRNLNLLVTARRNIGEKLKKVYKDFIVEDKKSISLEEVTYVNFVFRDIENQVSFRSKSSAFETLNNSTIFGKIQDTDLAFLLGTYYTNATKIKEAEQKYHERLDQLNQEWFAKFRVNNNDEEIFIQPFKFMEDFSSVEKRFLEILKDPSTTNFLSAASYEPYLIASYEEQLLMGNTIIRMIENSETSFDEQTKLDFSGILYSFTDADLISILIKGKVPTGFSLLNSASGLVKDYFTFEEDYLTLEYPEDTYQWASPYFVVSALSGRVNEMDFSGYDKMIIEMKGNVGGETLDLTMKDKNDPADGSESRLKLELTKDWKTYEIDTNHFKTADMSVIEVPLAFVFQGPTARKIHIRSIQFKKN